MHSGSGHSVGCWESKYISSVGGIFVSESYIQSVIDSIEMVVCEADRALVGFEVSKIQTHSKWDAVSTHTTVCWNNMYCATVSLYFWHFIKCIPTESRWKPKECKSSKIWNKLYKSSMESVLDIWLSTVTGNIRKLFKLWFLNIILWSSGFFFLFTVLRGIMTSPMSLGITQAISQWYFDVSLYNVMKSVMLTG